MAPRASSPALSESGFDISAALTDFDGARVLSSNNDADQSNIDIGLESLYDDDHGQNGSEDEAFIAARQAASNRKTTSTMGRSVKKGGGFQSMGFNPTLLKAISRKGFNVPTPIQRKSIPLILSRQDVVGMARTGSGKTAAFVLPMIERLRTHSARFGCRAIILSPSRELALQTLKVVGELSRGTDLRMILLVGGDSMEDQFSGLATNPDIIIATPGRLMHLKVESGLDLSAVQYVVFDEADRLFEMGFAVQLTEILHALPANRQTLLFSATLPKCLVEFTKAGLQDPHLIRLDVDSKISPDLQSAFFTVRTGEREGALLYLLQNVIKVPTGPTPAALQQIADDAADASGKSKKKRKRAALSAANSDSPTEHSTIVFAATKHCVEYLSALLIASGYAVSLVYGSLDQTARQIQVQNFRSGLSHILVVTDVAARGIDIPILANVINYNFPSQPKIFIHRVGRTARAGRHGWSYSLVREADVPYLVDLQLFLGRRFVMGKASQTAEQVRYNADIVVGSLPPSGLGASCEDGEKVCRDDFNVAALRKVAGKGEKLYERTRNAASSESVKRAKKLVQDGAINIIHRLLAGSAEEIETEQKREEMLSVLRKFRPQETVFELHRRGEDCELSSIAKRRRVTVLSWRQRKQDEEDKAAPLEKTHKTGDGDDEEDNEAGFESEKSMDDDDDDGEEGEEELEVTMFHQSHPTDSASRSKSSGATSEFYDEPATSEAWKDHENFITYQPRTTNPHTDAAYSISKGTSSKIADGSAAGTGSSFAEAAAAATLDLNPDESRGFAAASKPNSMRWDKKARKYVSRTHDADGSRTNSKMIRTEAGLKIPASFRSGIFDDWKKAHRVGRFPRVGETETVVPPTVFARNQRTGGAVRNGAGENVAGLGVNADGKRSAVKLGAGGTTVSSRFVHRTNKAPKTADKFRDDFHKQKKKVDAAHDRSTGGGGEGSTYRRGRPSNKPVRSEIKSASAIHKDRKLKERRKERNGRPSKKGKSRG